MKKFEMDAETTERRRRATARFMLRVIAAEQKHGIIRSDAVEFKARMERQANATTDRASPDRDRSNWRWPRTIAPWLRAV